jgi:hypothetical protein
LASASPMFLRMLPASFLFHAGMPAGEVFLYFKNIVCPKHAS